jgi:alpha-glucan,water dikinase
LIVNRITGEEEVPSNVQAIVLLSPHTGDHPDVLAHVSVRARNLKVMLAVLYDEDKCNEILELDGKHILLQTESSDNVKFEEHSPHALITRRGSSMMILSSAIEAASEIKPPPIFEKPVIPLVEFTKVSMGNKSNNLRIMKDKIPSWVNLPDSICLPFQMMEYTLKHCDPKGDNRIHRLIKRLS